MEGAEEYRKEIEEKSKKVKENERIPEELKAKQLQLYQKTLQDLAENKCLQTKEGIQAIIEEAEKKRVSE